MKLEILISTIDAGIDRTKHLLLPFRSDIKYIITHQYTDRKYISLPKELIRKGCENNSTIWERSFDIKKQLH